MGLGQGWTRGLKEKEGEEVSLLLRWLSFQGVYVRENVKIDFIILGLSPLWLGVIQVYQAGIEG